MAPDHPYAYPLSTGEQKRLYDAYGSIVVGSLFTPDPEHATGKDVKHVVVSAEVAHAVTLGHRELRRRKQRASRRSRSRNRG